MFGFSKKKKLNSDKANGNLVNNLHDEKALSEIILNSIDDGVILIDNNKVIQLFNKGAALITGWDQKDAMNLDYKSVINLVNDKNEPYTANQNPFELIFNEPSPIRDNKATLLTRNQKSVAISLSVSPLINQDNQTVAAVGVFRDVTREREEEKQRSEFISTASHEMRTPVAAIEGYLALAMNESVCRIDSRAREYLNKAHTSTDLLGKLFQDLLTSAKAEDGRLQNHPVVIELGGFLERIADDLRLIAEKKGLVVEYIIGIENPQNIKSNTIGGQKMIKPLYYVYADVERLSEVLVNLTDNAVKYTENGKITVSLTGNDSIVQIRVQDSGIGIPSEDIPHLFEKFYRVDTTATRTINGTGLGLYICRKIIELYNGRIWVDSKLGKGSTFYINLPRISSKTAQELQLKEDVENLPVGVSQSNKM